MKLKSLKNIAIVGLITLAGCTQTKVTQVESFPEYVAETDIIKSPNDTRQYRFITLENNMRVLLVSDPATQTAAVSLDVRVGGLNNPTSQPGLAHYLEHMLFLGTKSYPEADGFNKFLSENGGMRNAYTAHSNTNYYYQVVNGKLAESLARFSEFFTAPLFDKSYSEKELSAIDNEWSKRKSDDQFARMLINNRTSAAGHPIHTFSMGNKQTLSDKADSELYAQMREFYQTYYSANLMNLVIVSQAGLDELAQLAKQHFAVIKNHNTPEPLVTAKGLTENELNQHIYQKTTTDIKQLILQFPFSHHNYHWQDKSFAYVHKLFNSKDENTLYDYLNKQGLINGAGIGLQYGYYGDNGYIEISYSLTEKGKNNKDQIIAASQAYFKLIQNQGIQPQYFAELQQVMHNKFINFNMPSAVRLATHLSPMLHTVPAQQIIKSSFDMGEFSEQQINQLLSQIDFSQMRVWHRGNDLTATQQLTYADGQFDTQAISQAEIAQWQQTAAAINLALPGKNELLQTADATKTDSAPSSATAEKLLKPTAIVNKKGAYAWLAHSQHFEQNQGYIELTLNSDLAASNIKQYMAADILKHLWTEAALAQTNAAQQAGIKVSIGEGADKNLKVSLSGPTEQHLKLIENVFNTLVELKVDERIFNQKKDEALAWLSNRGNDPLTAQAQKEMGSLIHATAWRYHQQAQALEQLTYQDVVEHHNELLAKNALNLFAFGNYQQADISTIMDSLLVKLPANRQATDLHYPAEVKPASVQSSVTAEHTDVAVLQQYWLAEKSLKKFSQILTLNALYQPMFFKTLRTDNQVGYVVGSSPMQLNKFPAWGFMVQSKTHSAAQIIQQIDGFNQQFSAQLQALPATVVNNLTASIIQQINQAPKNIYQEMHAFLADFNQGNFEFDSRETLLTNLQQVTLADVQQVFAEVTDPTKHQLYRVEVVGSKFKLEHVN
ncbi:insulinase family protein [Catenovulum agarivorans]|uniref:insulinase family protein n=1 Tax=Catenovulum agarivorans TaxID=1172192 RepID=UPI00031E97E7|nr:insulinase family protein [Catenovulum agarivorans]